MAKIYVLGHRNPDMDSICSAWAYARLKNMIDSSLSEDNINEYGRFDKLVDSVDLVKAKEFFEQKEGRVLKNKDVVKKTSSVLRMLVLSGGDGEWEDYFN